jgi:hypothetical protein
MFTLSENRTDDSAPAAASAATAPTATRAPGRHRRRISRASRATAARSMAPSVRGGRYPAGIQAGTIQIVATMAAMIATTENSAIWRRPGTPEAARPTKPMIVVTAPSTRLGATRRMVARADTDGVSTKCA